MNAFFAYTHNSDILNFDGTSLNTMSRIHYDFLIYTNHDACVKFVFFAMGFHQGQFYFTPDYSMYPFDEQVLDIIVENSLFPSSELIFISDTSSYSRIKASILINRSFLPYISKLIIPLIIILILVYFVFFLPAEKLDIAAGLTVTSLLSAIAFQTAMSTDIPEIGYIIYIDKVFYTCYFLIALSMAQSLITYYLDFSGEEKKVKLASQIDYIFRFLFPLLFFAAVILFAL